MKKFLKKYQDFFENLIVCLVCLLLFFVLYGKNIFFNEKIEKVTYNDFIADADNGNIDTIYYSPTSNWMTYTLYNDETRNMSDDELEKYHYKIIDKRKVQYPSYDTFRKDMLEKNIKLEMTSNKNSIVSTIPSLLSCFVSIMIFALIFKSNNRYNCVQTSNVKFKDIIGLDETIEDVSFIVDLIKNNEKSNEIGVKIPNGILLSGEPGTGKTLIAKAIAGEAGVPFIYVNSSNIIDRFVGVGARNIRKIFKVAKEKAPCIVFFDEIDSIGVSRDRKDEDSENEQTINALLQELDGFTGREGIFVIAATNRADKLDSALTRAGRFDRHIIVNKPKNWEDRKKLFNFYLNKLKVSEDVNIDKLSKQSSGFTGADIAAICNEAGIIAIMNKKDFIDMACIEEAIDKKVFKGNRTKKEHFKEDKKIVAYHEAGHAVMHYLLGEPMSRASIIGTTSGVGGVVFGEDKDTQFFTKEDYENRVKICYAGRASEQIKFNSVTQGASSDITQATEILEEYVSKLGFDEKFGLLDMGVLAKTQIIDKSNSFELIQKKSKELYKTTMELLKTNYNLVELLANKLLEIETINGEDILKLFKNTN